jgi:hypothetical protein
VSSLTSHLSIYSAAAFFFVRCRLNQRKTLKGSAPLEIMSSAANFPLRTGGTGARQRILIAAAYHRFRGRRRSYRAERAADPLHQKKKNESWQRPATKHHRAISALEKPARRSYKGGAHKLALRFACRGLDHPGFYFEK